jgi:flagellar basal-body rod protein FlgB
MFRALFDSSTIPLLEQVAAFAERRHEVLAGNLANINTPDYRTRDLPVAEFQASLRDAVARHGQPQAGGSPGWSFAGDSGAAELFPRSLFRAVESAPRGVTFQDGNNRNIEREAMELNKNSFLQNVAIELMASQFSRLQAVISERP